MKKNHNFDILFYVLFIIILIKVIGSYSVQEISIIIYLYNFLIVSSSPVTVLMLIDIPALKQLWNIWVSAEN